MFVHYTRGRNKIRKIITFTAIKTDSTSSTHHVTLNAYMATPSICTHATPQVRHWPAKEKVHDSEREGDRETGAYRLASSISTKSLFMGVRRSRCTAAQKRRTATSACRSAGSTSSSCCSAPLASAYGLPHTCTYTDGDCALLSVWR